MNQPKSVDAKIQIVKDGPYIVSGGVPLIQEIIGTNEQGESVKWKQGQKYPPQEQYALCRCGRSANKPFCDGAHIKGRFDGTETASRQLYSEQAEVMRGPTMSLMDVERLCAFARFCDPHGRIWNLVRETDKPSASQHFVTQACDCPSGRLVAVDNETGTPIEPKYAPSIALIEDPAKGCSGPLWVRGGVPLIGADGFDYEVRNRMTLCRCGASENKPFCNGAHASIGFNDKG
ncbi:MAG: CDGSH iron-sulfur domain-containing protein [Acidiferrobacter sp.]